MYHTSANNIWLLNLQTRYLINFFNFQLTIPYPSVMIIFAHKHINYYLNPSIYFITHTPPMRPTVYNIYAIFHSFIISIRTIHYVHNYYLTHLLLLPFLLFYCIHTTYEIHSIQYLRYIPFIYYYYYNNTTPLNITPTYLQHNITHCNSYSPYAFTNQILIYSPSTCGDDILLHIYCQLKKIMQQINTHL